MAWTATVLALSAGCASGPLLDNPLLVPVDPNVTVENPVFVPGGPTAYHAVFERTFDVISDYFEVAFSSRWDGRMHNASSPEEVSGDASYLLVPPGQGTRAIAARSVEASASSSGF